MKWLLLLSLITMVSCGKKSNKRDLDVYVNPNYCINTVCVEDQGYYVNGTYYYYNGYHYLQRKCYCQQ